MKLSRIAALITAGLILGGCGGQTSDQARIEFGTYSVILSNGEVQYDMNLTIAADHSVSATGTYSLSPSLIAEPVSATGTLEENILHLQLVSDDLTHSNEAHVFVEKTADGFSGFDVFGGAPEVLFNLSAHRLN